MQPVTTEAVSQTFITELSVSWHQNVVHVCKSWTPLPHSFPSPILMHNLPSAVAQRPKVKLLAMFFLTNAAVVFPVSCCVECFLACSVLFAAGLLTWDPRYHERQKPGQAGARRKYTWYTISLRLLVAW